MINTPYNIVFDVLLTCHIRVHFMVNAETAVETAASAKNYHIDGCSIPEVLGIYAQ